MPVIAVFGAGNVAVGALPPDEPSEMKPNIYSSCFGFAVQLSDRGGSRIFIGEGLQILGRRSALAFEGVSNLLSAAMVEKAPFRARIRLCWQKGRHVCLEWRRRGRKERNLLSEGRIRDILQSGVPGVARLQHMTSL